MSVRLRSQPRLAFHASAILKEPETYEHVKPESVGNHRRVMVSDQGGKSNFVNELARRGVEVDKADPRLDSLIAIVKEREAEGYAYERRMQVLKFWRANNWAL